MSYIAYLNGSRIDISDSKPIAHTKQVNDIAVLSKRQTNFTHTFKLPLTPNNVRVLNHLYITGNQSNVPYQKNEFDLIDADTGKHLIYKGWANIKKTSSKEYECYVYDGLIDFYKEIENKNLTQFGLSELNHLKNVQAVVDSFENNLPYMYILADYNGNNICDVNNLADFNIDYQVPSARVSFLFDRIFQTTGYTYEGSVFSSTFFTNLFMTFPKSVPTSTPTVEIVTQQTSVIRTSTIQEPTPNGGVEYITIYTPFLFPYTFDNAYANTNTSRITIETAGSYRISAVGSFATLSNSNLTTLQYSVVRTDGYVTHSGSFNAATETKILSLNVGDKLAIFLYPPSDTYYAGEMTTKIEYILGYGVNFEEVLIDFKASDFINEIMQRFGLTMFKDKFKKHLKFKKINEIINSDTVIDWSDKLSKKISETYIYGNYAQKNNFKYKYNEQNENHNDGYFLIDNKNLKDETTVISSSIYSPEKLKKYFLNGESNVYKIWNKEVKEDGKIDYKELTGRFYFLRAEEKTVPAFDLSSNALNTSLSVSKYQRESYDRLKFNEIIYDNYATFEAVINKSKIIEAEFFFKTEDVANFNFEYPVFIDKLGSYFLVNRIVNFIKGKLTKVELIEIDRYESFNEIINYYLAISGYTLNDNCTITFQIDTNIPQPFNCYIIAVQPEVLGSMFPPPEYYETGIVTSNSVTISLNNLPNSGGGILNTYFFRIQTTDYSIISERTNAIALTQSCYMPLLTYITITNIETYQIIDNIRKIKVYFNTDLQLPNTMVSMSNNLLSIFSPVYETHNVTTNYILMELPHITAGNLNMYSIALTKESITSNSVISNN